ncbi:MAG: hypothetical protein WEA10_05600 [Actinomycetota bacterium]
METAWRWIAAIAGCLALAWFPFVFGTRVPLLGLVDLGFHELGHLLTHPLPDVWTAAMGSVTQVAVPTGLAGYFLWRRRDAAAAAICLAWAGTSAADASVYIADAPLQQLELIGGHHDWAFVLGRLQLLDAAGSIAGVVRFAGALLIVAALSCCVLGWARQRRDRAPTLRRTAALSVRPVALDAGLVPDPVTRDRSR